MTVVMLVVVLSVVVALYERQCSRHERQIDILKWRLDMTEKGRALAQQGLVDAIEVAEAYDRTLSQIHGQWFSPCGRVLSVSDGQIELTTIARIVRGEKEMTH
jgi:hypothetical protein